ncbi:AMP-dependent synthetase and ligase family protein isoform 2 [Theobroma cacao]|uniref:AMP-dependent synthetase and ligase family protein isoform 2 n=1 Tax=Theobroma cacao TaxID=3641 RepID=A0A061G4E2_THECC|nr:AMP-dependent synthetase and ligase family protein isoform 2 [Theobroma cacao]
MFLAVIRCRATAAPLNSAYTTEEFEFYLSDSQSKLLLVPAQGIKSAQAAASKLNIPHVSATLQDENSKVALSSNPDSHLDSVHQLVNDPADVSLFLHTSGTTSRPKGVPLTQLNLATSTLNIKSVYKLTESDSTVIVLPLFHVHGLLAGLLSSLISGAAVALPAAGRFSASTFWTDVIKYNATWYTAVPTIHQIILDRHESKPEPAYPNLRFIRSCSASLAPSVLARLEAAFDAPVLEAYAMTEASHLMASNPLPECGPHKAGSVGKPVGQKISPIEVDAVLLSHPNVAQAVAFGVPDEKYGEEINCAVIPREGVNLEEAEISQYCKKNLASFKVPKKVFITGSLPKTATGKIQRRIVAEHFLSQMSAAKVPKFGA